MIKVKPKPIQESSIQPAQTKTQQISPIDQQLVGIRQRLMEEGRAISEGNSPLPIKPNDQKIISNKTTALIKTEKEEEKTYDFNWEIQEDPRLRFELFFSSGADTADLIKLLDTRLSDFNPVYHANSNPHPLHTKIGQICHAFKNEKKTAPSIKECEKFIYDVIFATKPADLSSHLAPQDWPEGIKSRFKKLELALRCHLFPMLLKSEQAAIQEKMLLAPLLLEGLLPSDMGIREHNLLQFITRNGLFENPFPNFVVRILPEEFRIERKEIIEEDISKIPSDNFKNLNTDYFTQFVENKVKEIQPDEQTLVSHAFRKMIIEQLTKKMLTKQIEIFKSQFQEKGSLSSEINIALDHPDQFKDIHKASYTIHNFLTQNGTIKTDRNLLEELLRAALDVPNESQDPIAEARVKVESTKSTSLTNAEAYWFQSRRDALKAEIEKKTGAQLKLLDYLENNWDLLIGSYDKPIYSFIRPISSHAQNNSIELLDNLPKPLNFPSEPLNLQEPLNLPEPLNSPVFINLPDLLNLPEPLFPLEYIDYDFKLTIEAEEKNPASTLFPDRPLIIKYADINIIDDYYIQSSQSQANSILKTKKVLRYLPTDTNIPLISYVDRHSEFASILANPNGIKEKEIWERLPVVVRKDVLRHCLHYGYKGCPGLAEELAYRVIGTDIKTCLEPALEELEVMCPLINPEDVRLSEEFVETGKYLLNFYYNWITISTLPQFLADFKTLPAERRFIKCVHKLAKAAGVKVEPTDHTFWKERGMLQLSMQALEMCLHTPKSELISPYKGGYYIV